VVVVAPGDVVVVGAAVDVEVLVDDVVLDDEEVEGLVLDVVVDAAGPVVDVVVLAGAAVEVVVGGSVVVVGGAVDVDGDEELVLVDVLELDDDDVEDELDEDVEELVLDDVEGAVDELLELEDEELVEVEELDELLLEDEELDDVDDVEGVAVVLVVVVLEKLAFRPPIWMIVLLPAVAASVVTTNRSSCVVGSIASPAGGATNAEAKRISVGVSVPRPPTGAPSVSMRMRQISFDGELE
jgi:hypothetical protein